MENTLDLEIKKIKGPIAVFGAGGFVGANLFRRLLASRHDVYGVIHQDFIPWRLVGLDSTKMIFGDVTRADAMRELFARYKFQTIFYLAAYGGYARQTNAQTIFQTNVMGLLHVLEEAAIHGFAAFVNAGSSSEYGRNAAAPDEQAALQPNSHYAVSKVSASYLIQYLGENKKWPVVNLRLYSVYGPWEEADRLVPTLLQAGLAGGYPPFVDPAITRDFVYVDDAVAALVLAATRGAANAPGQSFNIATGVSSSIRDVAAIAKDLFNLNTDPSFGAMPNRAWDMDRWYGNPALAEKNLSWKAATPLKEGLKKTLAWTREQPATPQVHARGGDAAVVRLSAVIACYKDNEAIGVMHERLSRVFQDLRVDYEIIFVNDGSPDNTRELLGALCEKDGHVVAVEHSRNFGSQNAFLSGMAIATGDAVILLDGDLQDPPELIPEFFKRWKEGFEVVYGRRVTRQGNPLMNFCYKMFYRLFNLMAYIPIPLDAGDFSLMDRRVVDEMLKLPETDQFLRGLRAWVGFRQSYVDYVRARRLFGSSTNNWIKNIWWARKGIFSFSFLPLDLLFYSGIALTAFSLLALVVQIIYRLVRPGIPHGITTIIVLILFFGGLQVMGLSILGEYLGKTLEETKRRPKYIRRLIRRGQFVFQGSEEMKKFTASRRASP